MLTVLEIIKRSTEFFASKGIESPRLNAELLIGHALNRRRMQLYLEFERPLAETELERIRPLIRRRGQQEPLQYIIGDTEFCGLALKVDRRVLIPRPETEQLVEQVIAACTAPPQRILDLGTGSGAIALALAKAFPGAAIVATDLSEDALAVARENAVRHGFETRTTFVTSDWFSAVPEGAYDVIVSNPPYLSEEDTAATAPEVHKFEPRAALTSAEGGLHDLRQIMGGARTRLVPGGLLALETGISHHPALLTLATEGGFSRAESKTDLTGRDRFVLAFA
jgi:release factor glutamine methyltransferase